MNRRKFLAATSAAVLLSSTSQLHATPEGKLVFLTPFTLSLAFSPVLYAAASGKFQHQKLDVRIETGRGAAQVIQLVAAKQVDTGRTGGANYMTARAMDNSDVIAIGTIAQVSPFILISKRDQPIKTAAALKGKTVGLASFGGSMEATLNLMLAQAGVDPQSVRRERTADGPASFALLEAKRLDAFFCNTSTISRLEAQNLPIASMAADDGVPGQVYIAREADLVVHRARYVAFMRGVVQAVRELAAMDDQGLRQAITLMGKKFDIPGLDKTDIALADLRNNRSLWLVNGVGQALRNQPEQWSKAQQLMQQAGLMRATQRPLFTNKIWESAIV